MGPFSGRPVECPPPCHSSQRGISRTDSEAGTRSHEMEQESAHEYLICCSGLSTGSLDSSALSERQQTECWSQSDQCGSQAIGEMERLFVLLFSGFHVLSGSLPLQSMSSISIVSFRFLHSLSLP